MAWREQVRNVQELTGITGIEVLDDLILEWEELEELYAGDILVHGVKLEALTKNTRIQLRAHYRDYVNSFNDAVKNPSPDPLFPSKGRTMVEVDEWMKDEDRVSYWRTTAACLNRLKEIRKAIASKLPAVR